VLIPGRGSEYKDKMTAALQIKYLWHDVDVYKLRVSASNGTFSGGADVFLSIGGIAEAASALKGFPVSPSDSRELQFGAFRSGLGGGGVRLRLSCKDGAGHSVLEVRVESVLGSETNGPLSRREQTAHFFADVAPSAVDRFVAELLDLDKQKAGIASLRFANPMTR
jgi:hypothetical protein